MSHAAFPLSMQLGDTGDTGDTAAGDTAACAGAAVVLCSRTTSTVNSLSICSMLLNELFGKTQAGKTKMEGQPRECFKQRPGSTTCRRSGYWGC